MRAESNRVARVLFSLGVIALTFLILKPFLVPLMMSAVLAVLFFPVQEMLERRKIKTPVAAGLVTGGVTVTILVPVTLALFWGARLGLAQVGQVRDLKKYITSASNAKPVREFVGRLTSLTGSDLSQVFSSLQEVLISSALKLADWLTDLMAAVPGLLMAVVVTIIGLFFFLLDGRRMVGFLKENSFFGHKETLQLFRVSARMCRSVILATVVAGAAQALVFGVGMLISGHDNWALVSFMVFLMSFVPLLGSAPITFGLALYTMIESVSSGVVLLVAAGIVSGIDNIVRPAVLKGAGNLHPLLAFLGAFGGIGLFGIAGVFLGPIMMAIFVATVEILVAGEDPLSQNNQ